MDALQATTTSTNDLPVLREQTEAARLRLELQQINSALDAVSGFRKSEIMEAWGDLIDPRDYLIGDPVFDVSRYVFPTARLGDRQQGRNFPIVQNEQDLMLIRGVSRLLCETSPAAIGVKRNLVNFIVGTGFEYQAVATKLNIPENGFDPSWTAQLLQTTQRAIDDFVEQNDWQGDLDRELFIRDHRDGESFLALYEVNGGDTAARVVEPEQVVEPKSLRIVQDELGVTDDDAPTDWTFGIRTKANDIQSVLGYHVQWNASGSDWDYLPEENLEHAKLNVDRNIKRGMPDFYAVQRYLESAQKLLINTAAGAAIQAAIAYIVEYGPGSTQDSVSTMAAKNASGSVQRANLNGTTSTVNQERFDPGTILRTGYGQEYKLGPMSGAAGNAFIAVEQAVLRFAGVRWCMPEYMISGDASNGNYASTMVSESPFVKMAESEQSFYKRRHKRVLWKAVKNRFNAGAFAQFGIKTFDQLKLLVDIQVEAPAVAVRNELEAEKIRQIRWSCGVMSTQTWAMQAKLDFQQEQKNGAKERQQQQPNDPLGMNDPTKPLVQGGIDSVHAPAAR